MQWKKMTAPSLRRTGFARITGACCIALGACLFPGCMDCNDQFCKVTRKVGFDIYWIRMLCCEDPHRMYCREIVPLVPQLTNLMVEMQLSCDQANWHRMRQIWNEIRTIGLPPPIVQYYKDVFCGREVERGVNSHPFFGPGDVFRMPGVFAAVGEPVPMVVMPGMVDAPWMESAHARRNLQQAPEIFWETSYVLEPGAVLHAETWLGTQAFAATGTLAIARAQGSLEDWCREHRPTRMRIDLAGEHFAGVLTLDETEVANRVWLEEDGHGVLAARVDVEFFMRDDPTISLEGLFHEAWIELPVRFDGEHIVPIPGGFADGLTLLPVVPEIAALLPDFLQAGDAGEADSDCQAIANADLATFRETYADCFPDSGG